MDRTEVAGGFLRRRVNELIDELGRMHVCTGVFNFFFRHNIRQTKLADDGLSAAGRHFSFVCSNTVRMIFAEPFDRLLRGALHVPIGCFAIFRQLNSRITEM